MFHWLFYYVNKNDSELSQNFAVTLPRPSAHWALGGSRGPLPSRLCSESQFFLLKGFQAQVCYLELSLSLSLPYPAPSSPVLLFTLAHGPGWPAAEPPLDNRGGQVALTLVSVTPAQPQVKGLADGLCPVTFLVPRHIPLWGLVTRG